MDKTEQIHIGKLIRQELDKQGRSITWLAKQINCSRENLYKIFETVPYGCTTTTTWFAGNCSRVKNIFGTKNQRIAKHPRRLGLAEKLLRTYYPQR